MRLLNVGISYIFQRSPRRCILGWAGKFIQYVRSLTTTFVGSLISIHLSMRRPWCTVQTLCSLTIRTVPIACGMKIARRNPSSHLQIRKPLQSTYRDVLQFHTLIAISGPVRGNLLLCAFVHVGCKIILETGILRSTMGRSQWQRKGG